MDAESTFHSSMNRRMKKSIAVGTLALMVLVSRATLSEAANSTIGSGNTYNLLTLGDLTTLLPQGDLIRLGAFLDGGGAEQSFAWIQSNKDNVPALLASFVEFNPLPATPGTSRSSYFTGSLFPGFNGYWSNSQIDSASTLGLAGKQIFLWVLDVASPSNYATATEHGVFYADDAQVLSWAFPNDLSTPQSTTIALDDLTDTASHNSLLASAKVPIGSFTPSGTGSNGTFNLYAIPEPHALALVGLGVVGVAISTFARRRRS